MRSIKNIILMVSISVFGSNVLSQGDHSHKKSKKYERIHRDQKDSEENHTLHDHEEIVNDEDSHDEVEESHESHENGSKSKTILDIQEGGSRFRLSKKAISTLKVQYEKCKVLSKGRIRIPLRSLVSFGNEHGIFIHDSDWFRLIEVNVVSREKINIIVSANYFLQKNELCEIVVSGAPLLRVVQLEASGEGGEGHAH